MLFKFYKNTFKSPPPAERRQLFAKLYEEHGVKLIGVWKNQENPLEYYMITQYRDEDHHKQFIKTVRQMPEYLDMTSRINSVRLSSESVNLILEDESKVVGEG